MRTCQIEGCSDKHLAKGYCIKHYNRVLRYGDPGIVNSKAEPAIVRFNRKYIPITETGCWIWIGSTNPKGYGQLGVNGKIKLAHRISYEEHIGPIPDGMFVCHKCDIPACVNPNHLFVGTNTDNVMDMVKKGRNAKKISNEEAMAIKISGESQATLSQKYDVTQQTISNIKSGKRYIRKLGE